jgi:hypothetical protein
MVSHSSPVSPFVNREFGPTPREAVENSDSVILESEKVIQITLAESKNASVPVGLPTALAIGVARGSLALALVRDPAHSLTILRNAEQTISLSWRGAGSNRPRA